MFIGLIALAYLGIAALAVVFALWLVRGLARKAVTATVVAGLFAIWPVTSIVKSRLEQKEFQARRDAAAALFDLRCKTAGERITRTVDNVDGVVWMKWRDKQDNLSDQFRLDDPYGRDCGGEACIEQLLRLDGTEGRFAQEVERRKGRYRFVESVDPGDGKRYRYTGSMKPVPSWTPEAAEKHRREKGTDIPEYSYHFVLNREPIEAYSARYGITWDDVSTPEDREHWIAGGAIKVIDLTTNVVIAERVGYMMDRGLGSTAGFRSPWAYALQSACPPFPTDGTHTTRSWPNTETYRFTSNVLKTTRYDNQ